MEEKKKGWEGVFALLFVLAACALSAWLVRSGVWEKVNSVGEVRALIDRAGPLAGGVYFLVQLLSVILAPIPSNVTMLAGALALGLWPALLLGLAAIFAGSMLVFFAARRRGQRAVHRWLDRSAMERYLPLIEEKQAMFLFLALLMPFFPDDVLCILAGITTIPAARFALLVLLARPWGLAFAALLGSGAVSLPLWGWALMLLLLGAVFYGAMKYSRAIEDRLIAWISTIGRRIKP